MVADLDTSLSPEPGEDKTAQKAEISRGRREFRQHLPALRERFPLVFPEDNKAVKPLHHSVTAAVAQAMGDGNDSIHGSVHYRDSGIR